MFWSNRKREETQQSIDWLSLKSIDQITRITKESQKQPVIIFKHSTRCSISSMVLNRLENSWTPELNRYKTYYLDLITFREISNQIASEFGIAHESPQLLIVKDGEVIYHASHMAIDISSITKLL
jgi:bacillithiol system protein YtxJ